MHTVQAGSIRFEQKGLKYTYEQHKRKNQCGHYAKPINLLLYAYR